MWWSKHYARGDVVIHLSLDNLLILFYLISQSKRIPLSCGICNKWHKSSPPIRVSSSALQGYWHPLYTWRWQASQRCISGSSQWSRAWWKLYYRTNLLHKLGVKRSPTVHEHSITPTTCEFHVKLSRNLNIHESAPGLAIGAVAVSRLGVISC
jgi:hypothetical protein